MQSRAEQIFSHPIWLYIEETALRKHFISSCSDFLASQEAEPNASDCASCCWSYWFAKQRPSLVSTFWILLLPLAWIIIVYFLREKGGTVSTRDTISICYAEKQKELSLIAEISKGRIYSYWEGKKKHTHYQFQYIHDRRKVTHYHHQWGHYREYNAMIKQELHTNAINHQPMRLGKYKASQPQAPSVATVHPTAFRTLEEFRDSVIQCLMLPHNQLDLLTFVSESLCDRYTDVPQVY